MSETQRSISKYLATLQPISGRDEQPILENHVFLSYGSPSPSLFPLEQFEQAAKEVLQRNGRVALQYTGGEGPNLMKEWISGRGSKRNIVAEKDNILITAGAAQAIDVTTRALLNDGDEVWVEEPTYFFALHSFHLAGAEIRSFPTDDQGIDVNLLQKELEYRKQHNQPIPKLVYCLPNYQNPTGVTLTKERRERLAKLAQAYDFYIIEDDAYVELNFDQEHIPAIASYAPERVLYLGTFSKVLAPGLRIGWVSASKQLIAQMKLLLLGPETSPITQEILGTMLTTFPFEAHLEKLIKAYRQKRDVMIASIHAHFRNDVYFEIPVGGFFIWLRFKQHVDVKNVAKLAFQNGVSIVEGSSFFHNQVDVQAVRLCFSFCTEEQIELGVKRLAQAYFSNVSHKEVAEL